MQSRCKEMDIEVDIDVYFDYHRLIDLFHGIKAFPNREKLTFKLRRASTRPIIANKCDILQMVSPPSESRMLHMFVCYDYTGGSFEVELVKSVIAHSYALKRIIIHTEMNEMK